MPRSAYMNGVPKHFLKSDKFDFGIPAFAHLGEQAVLNAELYYDPLGSDTPAGTFGYQQRYAEYKYNPSKCVGEFGVDGSLKYWHLGREFSSEPTLNEDFILCDDDQDGIDRHWAVQTAGDHRVWFQLYPQIHATRS